MELLTYIEQFSTLSVFLRLVLSTLAGAAIGLERGVHGKNAGLRTFSLVCLGSALVMITDEYLVAFYANGDPARLGAQVISGVGFLGVGTIIITGRNYVKGLTTAASLWTTACLGIAIGSGYIIGGCIALLMIFFIMTVLSFISKYTDSYIPKIHLYLEMDKELGADALYQYVSENGYRISSINKQSKSALHAKDIAILLEIDLHKRLNHMEILESLNKLDDIHYVEEVH